MNECNLEDGARGCRFEDVESLNQHLSSLLLNVTGTAYFRYFKVSLFCDCPLWPDDGMCSLEACSVCECEDGEVPPAWKVEDTGDCTTKLQHATEESAVNRTLSVQAERELHALSDWKGLNNPWLPETDNDVEYSYINLLVNPERYTGYTGEHAHRIWSAIYSQNCFRDIHSEVCDEESLVFYRIISGVHASISMHLMRQYPLDEAATLWGPNLEIFKERMVPVERCNHVANLYFAYLFVLQAVARAAPALQEVHYHTGMQAEDIATQAIMSQVLSSPAVLRGCKGPFDVGRMWKGESAPILREQLRMHFQNITGIMDCVGCEKCKLWGKLQFLGVATALKILLSSNDCFERQLTPKELLSELKLERNEVIALINLLSKLSQSVATYRAFSDRIFREERIHPCFLPQDSVT